jgi:hypothetical protein
VSLSVAFELTFALRGRSASTTQRTYSSGGSTAGPASMSAGAAGAAAQGFKSFIRKSALRAIPKPVEPIPNWHIVRGDTVVVLRGRDKGKSGKVTSVQRSRNRVVIEGVNMVRRRRPPAAQRNTRLQAAGAFGGGSDNTWERGSGLRSATFTCLPVIARSRARTARAPSCLWCGCRDALMLGSSPPPCSG